MSVQQPTAPAATAALAACWQRLRTVFAGHSPVFIVDERFDPIGPLWRVMVVYQGALGRWYRRHYRYDIPSDTLYFAGEQPVTDDELRAARRAGKRL